MIIVKINLDPTKLDHHNVGFTDKQSGYGIIFDGDKWLTERIDVILEVLFDSKEKDLLKIYDEIRDFLSDDTNVVIKDTLHNLNKKINPRNKIDSSSKKNLIAHLKKHFYNNRDLVMEAKKYTDKNLTNYKHKNNYENILKDGITIEDIDKQIQIRKNKLHQLNLNKEIAFDILKRITGDISEAQFVLISELINKTIDIDVINIIIKLLTLSFCLGHKINNEIINEKIKKEEEICALFN